MESLRTARALSAVSAAPRTTLAEDPVTLSRSVVADGPSWVELIPAQADEWTGELLAAEASLFQLPFWNEPLRRLMCRPHYLLLRDGGVPLAFACVLEVPLPMARLGLVQRGPVPLSAHAPGVTALAALLARWADAMHYAALRFTWTDAAARAELAALPGARDVDAFPFYREPSESLLVSLADGDAVAAHFKSTARSELRRAQEAGYRVVSDDAPERLLELWPLFERLSQRKGFHYRRPESFAALMREARPHGAARLLVAYRGEQPVQVILVVRSRHVAHYVIGALDTAALDAADSPSVLLHWTAMREAARAGARHYDLGTRSGPVYQFKRKFRPVEHRHPAPVTLVLRGARYDMWDTFGVRAARTAWPTLKALLSR